MLGLDLWTIWLIIGIVCLILEIFTPGFYFMSIGAAAILTGLFGFFVANFLLQLIVFVILSLIIFLLLRKIANKFFFKDNIETNVMALVGKKAKVTQNIEADEKGYVKVDGEEWMAITTSGKELVVGTRVEIVKIEGTKLVVKKATEE